MAIVSVSRTSITDEGRSRSLIAASPPETLGGMVLMTPTSIASTGSGNSSSIGTNGSVTFSSCATLSLNGVFTSEYDNYMVVIRNTGTTDDILAGRLRSSGTDASGSNYTRQYLVASSTSVTAARESTQTSFRAGGVSTVQRDGTTLFIYGPNLAQPTAFRHITAFGYGNAEVVDSASTHSLSTSYDGLTLFPVTGNFTGLVSVYGLVGA